MTDKLLFLLLFTICWMHEKVYFGSDGRKGIRILTLALLFIIVVPDKKVECNELPFTHFPSSTAINSWLISKDGICN